jgi:hypothetical protein
MRVLARRIERVVARCPVVFANSRPRLHWIGDQPVVDDVEARYMVRPIERGLDGRFVAEMPIKADVV